MTRNFARDAAAKVAVTKTQIVIMVITILGSIIIGLLAGDAKVGSGRIAGFVIAMASIPYAISIFQGKTTPNRTSWLIWSMLSILLVTSYHDAGASNTIWVPLIYVADQMFVAIVSLFPKYGEGGKNKFDIACAIGAVVGIVLWWLSGPVLALMFFILSDLLGSLPTAGKAFERPKSEDTFAWVMTFAGNGLNIFAVEKFSAEILAYPLYAVIMSGIILFPLIRNKFRF